MSEEAARKDKRKGEYMKKLLLLFLTGVTALALVACGGGKPVDKDKLALSTTSITLTEGKSETVSVTISDELLPKVKVSSSSTAIATVTISGKTITVTGVAKGSAAIAVTVEGTEQKLQINVTVNEADAGDPGNESKAKFANHTGTFFVDIAYGLETEIQEAISGIKAYDDDGTEITTPITVIGIETIDVNQGAGARFQLQISVQKANGTALTALITVELLGVLDEDKIVIFGPSTLAYYRGSVGFELEKEFTAVNIKTGEPVPVIAEYLLGKELTLNTNGKHSVKVIAEQGDITVERDITLNVKSPVTIKNTLTPTTAAQPITINFGHGNGQDIEALFKTYATNFEAAMLAQGHHVKVNVTKVGSTYDEVRDTITSAMQSQTELPHIIQNYPDHLVEYNGYGKIVNLAPYAFHPTWGFGNDADKSWYDIVQSYRDEQRAASFDGELLSMPFNKSTEMIIYNKDMFDAVLKGKAFPTTWEDLMALHDGLLGQVDANIARIASAYQRAGNNTYTTDEQQKAKNNFYSFSYDSGGNAFITLTKAWGGAYTAQRGTKQEKLLFVNEQTKQMLTYFGSNRDKFTYPTIWGEQNSYATDFFKKGYSAFSVSSTAGADKNTPQIGTSKLFNVGVAPMLYSKLYPEQRNAIQQGTNFALTTQGNEDQRIVSWLFLKYLNEKETSLDYALNKGYFPTRNSTLNSTEYQTFLAKADLPITDGMSKKDADEIMRAKAAQVYFAQKDYMVFDLPFVGSSAVRKKVEVVFKDVMLALPAADLQQVINSRLQTAYDESLRLVSDD